MKCPLCGDGEREMDEILSYDSTQQHLEVSYECPNRKCPARFFGILYLTNKSMEKEDKSAKKPMA